VSGKTAKHIWRQAAENVAETLQRGARVIVQGRLKQRTFDSRDGDKRTVIELEVDEIGPSLRHATAKVNKVARSDGGYGTDSAHRGGGGGDDPWASAPPSGQGQFSDEPPF
jgi:single-strand DNA-binding protein